MVTFLLWSRCSDLKRCDFCCTITICHIYFPYRWPLRVLNLCFNLPTHQSCPSPKKTFMPFTAVLSFWDFITWSQLALIFSSQSFLRAKEPHRRSGVEPVVGAGMPVPALAPVWRAANQNHLSHTAQCFQEVMNKETSHHSVLRPHSVRQTAGKNTSVWRTVAHKWPPYLWSYPQMVCVPCCLCHAQTPTKEIIPRSSAKETF